MKNFTKPTIVFVFFFLLIVSCKDNTLEDLESFIGKKCLEKIYEKYEKGQFIYRRISEYNEFNKLSKQTTISPNSTSITLYEYDKNNNLIRLTNEKGAIVNTYQYDSNNRLIKEGDDNSNSFVINYTYHGNGNLQKQSILLAGLPYFISEFNETGKLLRKYSTVIDGNPLSGVPLRIVEETETIYKYNAKDYVLSNYETKNKQFSSSYEYEYDSENRITKSTQKDLAKTTIIKYTYQLDNKNRVISKKTDNLSETKYEYNSNDSVTKIIEIINGQLRTTFINEYDSSKRLIRTLELDSTGNIIYKNEKAYYSDNNLKISKSYYLKNGTKNELYIAIDVELNPCGNIVKDIIYNTDGSEQTKNIVTYLYR